MPKDLTQRTLPDALLGGQATTLTQTAALDARSNIGSNVIESMVFFDYDTNANAFNFPAKLINAGPRRRLVIQNLGTNPFQVQFKNTTNTDYNAPSWTGATTVAANQQLEVSDVGLTAFIRPSTVSTAISGVIYLTVGSL